MIHDSPKRNTVLIILLLILYILRNSRSPLLSLIDIPNTIIGILKSVLIVLGEGNK